MIPIPPISQYHKMVKIISSSQINSDNRNKMEFHSETNINPPRSIGSVLPESKSESVFIWNSDPPTGLTYNFFKK